jgi:hypothetical protein
MYKATIKVPFYYFASNEKHTNIIENWAKDNCKSYTGYRDLMQKNMFCWEFSFEDEQDQLIFILRWS